MVEPVIEDPIFELGPAMRPERLKCDAKDDIAPAARAFHFEGHGKRERKAPVGRVKQQTHGLEGCHYRSSAQCLIAARANERRRAIARYEGSKSRPHQYPMRSPICQDGAQGNRIYARAAGPHRRYCRQNGVAGARRRTALLDQTSGQKQIDIAAISLSGFCGESPERMFAVSGKDKVPIAEQIKEGDLGSHVAKRQTTCKTILHPALRN
nr:hypothetical protein [Novosphingobium sp. KA1]